MQDYTHKLTLENILECAEAIADAVHNADVTNEELQSTLEQGPSGPNEAAKFLAPYRRQYAEDLAQNPKALAPLLAIVTAQCDYLVRANEAEKASSIADWFTHVLHQNNTPNITQIPLKNAYARFFRTHARALKALKRYTDMRLTMRNAIDASSELPLAIISLIHLYADIAELDSIEEQKPTQWLSDRFAECLAALDFAGLNDTNFRHSLNDMQFALRYPNEVPQIYLTICERDREGDLAHNTLCNIFKWRFIDPKV